MNRGAFQTLTRHFMNATLAPDILTDAGVDYLRRLLFGVLAVLLVTGIFLPRLYFKKYTDLSALVSHEPYLRALQADTLLMLAVPMLLIALATVVAGPLLFPDETDYRVLTPLPISRAHLFGAKLTAVAVLMMAAIVAVTLVATFWFPLTSGGRRAPHPLLARMAAHAVASVAACVFAAAATMAAQGLVLVVVPQAWQRRVAAVVQGALAVLLLLSLPVIGRMSSMDVTHVTVLQPPLMWMPPSWFLGFERWLLDGSAAGGYARAAAFAGAALAAAVAIVAANYAQLYRSAERLAGTTGADRRAVNRVALRSRLLAVLPLPRQTLAIIEFVLNGVARSRLHQLVFVLAVAGGIAALAGEMAAVMEGTSHMASRPRAAVQAAVSAPLLVALTFALGLRAAWRWPLDRGAAWIFHLTDDVRTRADVLSGVSVCLSAGTWAAAMLTAVALQPRVLGASARALAALGRRAAGVRRRRPGRSEPAEDRGVTTHAVRDRTRVRTALVRPRLALSSGMPTRREFLRASALAGGALGLTYAALVRVGAAQSKPKPLRILILGGTGFIGPHQVRYAVARGHHVTLFNRGRTNPGLFKGLTNIDERIGDRAPKPGNYEALKSGEWDVVIDNPTTRPRWVREAAAALKGRVGQYVFISTMSAYAAHDTPGADETAALATTTTPDVEEGPEFLPLYGPLKALAEQEAQKAFPNAATIIRPGLIVGVGDTTDRFTYWPVRIARGGEVLAPPAADPVQIIDARDLSEWVIRCCEEQRLGVFNAGGEGTRFNIGQMLDQTRAALGSNATFTHATTEFLLAQKVYPWSDLPVWLPAQGASAGAQLRSVARARAAGLTYRPFSETAKETMAFYQQQSEERKAQLRAGLPAEREAAVLAAWKARAVG